MVTLSQLVSLDLSNKNVLIIGCPASGKTWLSKLLSKPTHKIIHTDSYIKDGYLLGMYSALNAVAASELPTLVEGVFGYRMLRKGCEYASYYPDIVIEMKISEKKMIETYRRERDSAKIKYLQQFNSSHEKILMDYKGMCPLEKKPTWITFLNNY